jgi:menaquinone-dependent protoporphyrinogen IX oxidase
MKIALVYFAKSNVAKFEKIAEGFKETLSKLGHDLEIINGSKEEGKKLTIYKYIIIGTEAVSLFGGRIPEFVPRFLGSSGMLTGKNSFAFVVKSTIFGTQKSLNRLMKAMEHEGLLVTYNEIINSKDEAIKHSKRIVFE